ncbi:hypothetical protein JCM5296_000123 [Sporobolomyces johnsonii]
MATSSGPTPALSALTPAQLKALKATILTEHFRFAPETFAKGGMDLANASMYAATAQAEASLQKLVDDKVPGFEADEVQRGIYRLETLLEHAIDSSFDLFEIYVLRNTFTFPDPLVPYIALPHQEHLDPALEGTDEATLQEYETELRLFEEELQKERELGVAELFLRQKAARLQEQAEHVGYMKGGEREPLSERTEILTAHLASLQTRLSELLATPTPPAHPSPSRESAAIAPWATSRSAFVNWAAAKKAVALPRGNAQDKDKAEDAVVGQLQGEAKATGAARDAKALLSKLNG